jgi:molybdenum cofactor cytidylyltransferase
VKSSSGIAAVVLAAGGSTRLGQPKQLLNVDGMPLLARTLEAVRRSSFTDRIVVLGAYADEVRAQVSLEGFTVVENPNYLNGQSTSMVAGLRAVSANAAGAVVLLGDQPLLPPGILDRLVAAFDAGQGVAVRPRYANGPGNPVLLGRALFPELMRIEGDVGAREVLARHAERIIELDVANWTTPRDVDTLDDYLALLDDWASLGAPEIPRYCQRCGGELRAEQRQGRLRPVCPICNFTAFHDPKIAVATIVEIDGRIVMQRRAVDPGRGKWSFPSGFVDRGEPLRLAAAREVEEEVGIRVDQLELLDVYSEAGETVALVVFHGRADGQLPEAREESLDVALADPDDLPELAFPRDSRIIADWLARRLSV